MQPDAPQDIQPPPPKRHNIFFSGDILPQTVCNIRGAFAHAVQENAPSINFFFSSTGGDLCAALSLYHFLRALPVPFTIYNVGTIESAAVMIYMAADTRLAAEETYFLIHSFVSWFHSPNIDNPRLNERSLVNDRLAEIYVKIVNGRIGKTNYNLNVRERLMGEAGSLLLTPASALDAGIVTGIVPMEGVISSDDVNLCVASST
jgi:ATP-dependent protease ClpP protease subunit